MASTVWCTKLCIDQRNCQSTNPGPYCDGVPKPLSTTVSDCQTGYLMITYTNTNPSTISAFSYVSCNSARYDMNSSTNYNLPTGVTAKAFSMSYTCPVLTMTILGSDSHSFVGDEYARHS